MQERKLTNGGGRRGDTFAYSEQCAVQAHCLGGWLLAVSRASADAAGADTFCTLFPRYEQCAKNFRIWTRIFLHKKTPQKIYHTLILTEIETIKAL